MKLAAILLFLLSSAIATENQQAITIPIQNPSFEEPTALYPWSCGTITLAGAQFPGWDSYSARVLTSNTSSLCDFSNPPDGKQMAMIYQGFISKDLGDIRAVLPHDAVTGETNGVLRLRFSVANYFYWYRGHYTASILMKQGDASTTLCSTSGWGVGDFTKITLTCPEQRAIGHLVIKFESGSAQTFVPDFPGVPTTIGYQMLFDNVSLTFTPAGE